MALVGHAGIKGEGLVRNKGKGSTEEVLPNRMVLSELTKGDPVQRSLRNYAKASPGVGNPGTESFMDDMKLSHGGSGIPNRNSTEK